MKNLMEISETTDKEVWDVFVLGSPQRSIFVRTCFLDALYARYKLIVCRRDGKILAGAVIIFDELGNPIRKTFPFTQYQGLLFADQSDLKCHSRLAREYKIACEFIEFLVMRYGVISLTHSWRLGDMRPFQWYGYNEPSKDRFKIDLRYSAVLTRELFVSDSDYLASVRSVRRQEYKKAERNLKFRNIYDESVFVDLYQRTFARQGNELSAYLIQLLKSILRRSVEGGFGKMAIAFKDEIPISAVLFLYDDRSAYYLYGANHPEYRNCFGGTYLLINMIRDAFARGYSEVDLVGVNSPDRGDFKLSLNPELRQYFVTSAG